VVISDGFNAQFGRVAGRIRGGDRKPHLDFGPEPELSGAFAESVL
jgi:hypothetical protein